MRQDIGTVPARDRFARLRRLRSEADGSVATFAPPGRDLPRHDARRRSPPDLSGRRGPALLPRPLRAVRAPLRLVDARFLPDGQPLPPRRRVHAAATFGRHAVPQRPIRRGLQRQVRPHRSPLRRPFPCLRRRGRGVPGRARGVRARQPGPRRPLQRRGRVALERSETRLRPDRAPDQRFAFAAGHSRSASGIGSPCGSCVG